MVDIKKIKLQTNIEEAINITNNPDNYFRYMSSYSPILGATNENQNEIAKIIKFQDKKVLVPGSSGDQYLSSVFFGSQEETIYDINSLSEFYIFLKICAIRNLKYDDFIEFIFPYISKEKHLSPNTIKYLLSELPSHIKEFWTLYLDEIDINKIGNLIKFLDTDISDTKKLNPYLGEKNYNSLKEMLIKKDYPKFIEADVAYFEYSIKDYYDFISLSNIIECNQQPFDDIMDRRLYTDEEWITYIKTVICKHLNPNGELLVLQTGDWNSEQYVKEGFNKYIVNSNTDEKNVALVLKR